MFETMIMMITANTQVPMASSLPGRRNSSGAIGSAMSAASPAAARTATKGWMWSVDEEPQPVAADADVGLLTD